MADGYGRRRLDGWDYSRPTAYFATFCAHGRRCVLGRVIEGPDGAEVELSALGRLCADEAAALPSRLPNVSLDGFAIMPNHVHALIILDGGVTLGRAIGVWKAKTTARAREAGFSGPLWQKSFHDHVVRDEEDLERLRRYIRDNPRKWAQDRFFGPPR